MPTVSRSTARVVPVADDGTCLLLLEEYPAGRGPFWGSIGGAIDPGETPVDAAVRELWEETGIVVEPGQLVGPVARVVAEFSWAGVDYRGDATVFALPLSKETSVSFEHLVPEEIDTVMEARWLAPGDALADGRLVWPELPEVMTSAVEAVRGQQ